MKQSLYLPAHKIVKAQRIGDMTVKSYGLHKELYVLETVTLEASHSF
jgi:hypothetical protein